ncbi:MAG: FecR domain-containing protein [Tannerella sp.]|jgi:ferric-dicitrate binding protein FerR (iron transport regulator)|nr:FecR domain-containing protein [Tannerella sp.]
MNTDHTTYTADELLRDDDFLRSELYPTEESRAYWSRLHACSPSTAREIDVARRILSDLRQNCGKKCNLSPEDVETLWEKINRQNRRYDRRLFRRIAGVAASICLILAAGGYVYFSQQQSETDYLTLMHSFESTAGNEPEQVQLVLSDRRKIAIDGNETQVDYDEAGYVKINSEHIIEAEAETKSRETTYNQLIVPQGKRSTITFNDGTRVWINSGSKIIYPVAFEKNRRELFVEGEIYLDVAKDEKRPFVVKTGSRLDVTVLGTAFGVKACGNNPDMQVVLVSGKVEVKLDGSKNILAPNQLFSYNSQTSQTAISTVDVIDYIAWKDGYYPFKQEKLSAVLRKLAGYYGITFEWDEAIDTLTCSGKFDLKEDLDEVLRTLGKTAPINIRKTDGDIYQIDVKP